MMPNAFYKALEHAKEGDVRNELRVEKMDHWAGAMGNVIGGIGNIQV